MYYLICCLALGFVGVNGLAIAKTGTGTLSHGSEVEYTVTSMIGDKHYNIIWGSDILDVWTAAASGDATQKSDAIANTLGGRAAVTAVSGTGTSLKLTITLDCFDHGKTVTVKQTDAAVTDAIVIALTGSFVSTALANPMSIKVDDEVEVYAAYCGIYTDDTAITVTCGTTTQNKVGKVTIDALGDLVSTTLADIDTDAAPAIGKAGGTAVTTLTSTKNLIKLAIKDFTAADSGKTCKFTASTSDEATIELALGGASAVTCGLSLVLALAVAAKELMFA